MRARYDIKNRAPSKYKYRAEMIDADEILVNLVIILFIMCCKSVMMLSMMYGKT